MEPGAFDAAIRRTKSEPLACGGKPHITQDATQPISSPTVSVVLPTMNEAENVGELCQKLRTLKQNYEMLTEAIFVINNTTDGTDRVLDDISKRPGCEFLRVAYSEGARGTAIRRGVEMSRGEVVVVMDSDGQYDPEEIPRLVKPIVNEGYCIVVGRNHGWAGLRRRIISETFKKLTKLLLGVEYVQTGFKAGIRNVLLRTIPEDVSGLDIDVRWMDNVIRKGYGRRLCDHVEVRLHRRLHGRTTFSPLKLSLGLLYTTISLAIQRRTGRELPFPKALKEITLQPEKQIHVKRNRSVARETRIPPSISSP